MQHPLARVACEFNFLGSHVSLSSILRNCRRRSPRAAAAAGAE
jgi:hypothetical protein